LGDPIVVGGLTPLTTIDYPGELAAVLFLQGCPWSCGYCQNSELLPRNNQNNIPWQTVISFLEKRNGLLDAVVFSGGEPTLQAGVMTAVEQVKAMGFKVGLHTAGIYPERLQKLLPLLDWVGMDIKASEQDYEDITLVKGSGERAWKSARVLMESGVDYEFRTTIHPDMLNESQIEALTSDLKSLGVEHFVIQKCITERCLDDSKRTVTIIDSMLNFADYYSDKYSRQFKHFSIRQ